eukprot:2019268-Amphidinium_carterae.1
MHCWHSGSARLEGDAVFEGYAEMHCIICTPIPATPDDVVPSLHAVTLYADVARVKQDISALGDKAKARCALAKRSSQHYIAHS